MTKSVAQILTGSPMAREISEQMTLWLAKPGCYVIFGPAGIEKDSIATAAIQTRLDQDPDLTSQVMTSGRESHLTTNMKRVTPVIIHDADSDANRNTIASEISAMADKPADASFISNVTGSAVMEAFIKLVRTGGSVGTSLHAHSVAEGLVRLQRMIDSSGERLSLNNLPLLGAVYVRPTQHKGEDAIEGEILNIDDKFEKDRIRSALQSRNFAGLNRYTKRMIQIISKANATALKKSA